ncbi:eukaryotic translation initiation factor 4 gamma 1-like [Hetaerina americana]|uniref:eukaryotic translation initiation factor 4 gamma 1-like n=1 Tax=Hetaerina americana TaxID=62018 RepID=UPI003A7F3A4E
MVSRTKEPVHCFVQHCAPTHHPGHQHHGHHQHHHHQAHHPTPPPHLGHPHHPPHHPHPHHHPAHPHHHHQASQTGPPPPPAALPHPPPPIPPPQQPPQNPQTSQQQQQAQQQPQLGPFRIVTAARISLMNQRGTQSQSRPDVWATGFPHQGGALRNIPPNNLPPPHHTSAIGGLGPGGGAGPQGGGGGGGGGGGPAQAPTPPGASSHEMAKQGGGPPTPQSSHMAAQPHMPGASGMHMSFGMSNQQRLSGPQSYGFRANNAARLVTSRSQVMTPNGVGHLGFPHMPYSTLPVVAASPMNSQTTLYMPNNWYPPGAPPRQPGAYTIHPAAQQQMMFQPPLYSYTASPQPNQVYLSPILRGSTGGGSAGGGGHGGTPPQQPALQQQSPVAPMAQQGVVGGGGGSGLGGGGGGPPPSVGLVSNVMGPPGVVGVSGSGGGPSATQQDRKPRKHAIQIVDPDTGHDVVKKMLADEASQGSTSNSSSTEASTQEESMKLKKEFTALVLKVAKSPSESATPPPQPQTPETSSGEALPPASGALNGPSDSLYSIPSENVGPPQLGMNVASEPWKQNPDKERDHLVEPCEAVPAKAVVPMEPVTKVDPLVGEEEDGANIVVVVPPPVPVEAQQQPVAPLQPPTPVVSARGQSVRVPSPMASSVVLATKVNSSPGSAVTTLPPVINPIPTIQATTTLEGMSMAQPIKEPVKEAAKEPEVVVPPKQKLVQGQKVAPVAPYVGVGEPVAAGKKMSPASREASVERKKVDTEVAPKEGEGEERREETLASGELLAAPPPMDEQQPPPLPQRQPQANGDDGIDSKATQKSKQKKLQKNRDLNRKGAEKEGTDMDAFSDAQQRQQQQPEASSVAASPTVTSTPAVTASANSDALPAPVVSQRIETPVVPPPASLQSTVEKVVHEVKLRTMSPPPGARPSESPVVPPAEKGPAAVGGPNPPKGAVNNVESAILPTLVNSTSSSLSSSTSSLKSDTQPFRAPSSKPGIDNKNWDVKTASVEEPVASEADSVGSPADLTSDPEKEVAVEKPTEEDSLLTSQPMPDDANRVNEDTVKVEKETSSAEKMDRQEDIVAAKNSENVKVSSMVDTNKKPDEKAAHKTVNSDAAPEAPSPGPTPLIENNASENKMKFNKDMYKDDQWSPMNPQGKKKYERDFLMHFRNDPQSMKKPENLPDIEIVLKDSRNRQAQAMFRAVDVKSIGNLSLSSPQDFAPGFVRASHQGKPLPLKRRSQQGNSKMQKVIHVSLSLNEDPKLHEAENAWKPRSKIKENSKKEDGELYAAMRGILNKLTPQNFDKLVLQVMKLPIDSMDKLKGVIDLVFDKAVDEPNFSVAYAELCNYLNSQNISRHAQKNSEESSSDFRKILLKRCQTEFEKDKATGRGLTEKLKEIDKETSEEKRKELKLQIEEDERRMRRKSVGVTRFIGELYKLGMINQSIMVTCIRELLETRDEESLECLCKLLTTVGKVLEEALEKKSNPINPPNLNGFFNKMKMIVQERKTSSRVRFMLQDAIDLKNNKWVPRRDESNPKKISQIAMEAERESMEQSQLTAAYAMPSRSSMGGGGSRKDDRGKPRMDGWTTVPQKTSKGITVDTGKIKVDTEVGMLGPNNHIINWSRGASGGSSSARSERKLNSYHVLSDMDGGTLGGERYKDTKMPRYKDSPQSYTKSASASYINSEDDRSRMTTPLRKNMGGPQTSMESSRLRSGGPPSKTPSRDSSVVADDGSRSGPPSSANKDVQLVAPASLPPEKVERVCLMIIEDYVSDLDAKEACLYIKEKLPVVNYIDFVCFSLEKVLELSPPVRTSLGKFMIYLINEQLISKQLFVDALNKLLVQAEDMLIDVPKFWDYIADILVVLLEEEVLPMSVLRELTSHLQESKLSGPLVLACLNLLFKNKGHMWISEKWKASSLQWKDLMAPEDVDSFVKKHSLEYVMGGSGNVVFSTSSKLSMEEVKKKLDEFLSDKVPSTDQIFAWIEGNVGEGVHEPQFIRALTTAVLENAIENDKLNEKVMDHNSRLLQKYVVDEEKELTCLYASQALVNKLVHPKGLICGIFNFLWDNDLISQDTFKAWDSSKEEQDGKALAQRYLTQFFTYLNETEDCDSSED